MRIRIKRVYEAAEDSDGLRVLVDRLWPRGIKKTALAHDLWLKDIAPSNELRQWIHADPGRWNEFVARYHAELDEAPAVISELLRSDADTVTLLYAARDERRNHALVLKAYLERTG